MNDYIDYYTYMNNLNQMQNMDQIMNPNQFGNQNQTVPKKTSTLNVKGNNDGLAEPYPGFIRGNMFDNLYSEYKNYKTQELKPQNDKEYSLLLLQMYGFAAHDLGLYLDVNPNDSNAIAQRAEFINMYNEALAKYESTYGPITKNSEMLSINPWAWDSKKWPWEGMK